MRMESQLSREQLNGGGKDKRALGVLCILLSAFFFSLMSVFVRLSGDLPTFQKALFRNAVAAVTAFCLLVRSRSFAIKKGCFLPLLARAVAGTVGIIGNFYAIDHMYVSDASLLNKLAPFFSVIFSFFILKEKASWKDWLLVFIAFFGALFVVKPSFDLSKSIPALVGVLGALGAGLAYTFVRYLGGKGERASIIVFYFSVFSTAAVLPMAIADFQPMTAAQVVFLLLAGLAASVAQFALTTAYSFAPAKEISVYDYSQVLFAAIWGVLFFSELPDWISFIGYAIIISAALVKYFLGKKK